MPKGGSIEFSFDFRSQRFEDAEKGLKAFSDALGKDFNDTAPKTLSAELRSFLDTVAEALAERHGEPWPSTTAVSLSTRSGDAVQSIIDSVRVEGSTFADIVGYIGGAFPLTVHEFGATINASKAKFLTIPLPAALDSRGVPLKKSARQWSHTFVARSKKGNLLIFQKVGTQIIPLYVLRSSVTIPPRLGMSDTIQTGIPYFVERAVDAIVKVIVESTGG